MEKNELTINLEQDLNEISAMIWAYMDKKYIGQLRTKLNGYRSECESNLCKEAELIRAVIPFMPEQKKILQFIVDAIIYNDMIEKSFEKHKEIQELYRDDNKEKEQIKKLLYKLIAFKLVTAVEKGSIK
ncbi:hypothetical protein [Cellulosilyticum ruminicola]|uniref:hypothetical protein n=1 Tax=Cellulosilyticum ruminicola TaxID=425254 RepID=UPI0006D0201C|nr:hypothetical protein [Cellulosilyticum ruminicola]